MRRGNLPEGNPYGTNQNKTLQLLAEFFNTSGNPSGGLPRYARNDTVLRTEWNKFCLLKNNNTFNIRSLCYCVQRTLCHCETPLCGVVAIAGNGNLMNKKKRGVCLALIFID